MSEQYVNISIWLILSLSVISYHWRENVIIIHYQEQENQSCFPGKEFYVNLIKFNSFLP